ncbi:lytic transglycosylase [Sulfurifustis variabilis]|uniref:Lytic transglycosylase n=1 Tax=Sulfurifustis variabilis TaxID=1675686 RepID=A0A1B4V6L0_9GAMM|nr:lytic transglycosylase domain-containing protein [Sulfurifustis variabilis]BAU49148.1 lytic transglycosylase [Sulfurifustis variabilis]
MKGLSSIGIALLSGLPLGVWAHGGASADAKDTANRIASDRPTHMVRVKHHGASGVRTRFLSAPARRFHRVIQEAAERYKVDAALLHAVIAVESAYNPRAVSPKGARGLMQLMPAIARHYGCTDPYDPEQNIRAGARHLGVLLRRFKRDLSLALAAYNAGEPAVISRGNTIPPYPETLLYVPKVLEHYQRLRPESMAAQ